MRSKKSSDNNISILDKGGTGSHNRLIKIFKIVKLKDIFSI
jgi:hypothetical protein